MGGRSSKFALSPVGALADETAKIARLVSEEAAKVIKQLGAQGVELIQTVDGQIKLLGTLQGVVLTSVNTLVETTTGELVVLSKDTQGAIKTVSKLVRTADGTIAALGQVATNFVETAEMQVQQVAWETNTLIRNADGQLTALGEQLRRSMYNLDDNANTLLRDAKGQLTLIGHSTNELITDLNGNAKRVAEEVIGLMDVGEEFVRNADNQLLLLARFMSVLLVACTAFVSVATWSKICTDALYPWLGRDKLLQLHAALVAALVVVTISVALMWGLNQLTSKDHTGLKSVDIPKESTNQPRRTEAIGGVGGEKFKHGPPRIEKIAVWIGEGHIKGIKIVESGIDAPHSYVEGMWKNTDDSPPTSEFEFQEDERITSLKMWEGRNKGCLAVFGGFEFITSKGEYYRAIGDGLDYDDSINIQIPSVVGVELAGFYGRSALVIDQLGFYLRKEARVSAVGGRGGVKFRHIPTAARIEKIAVWIGEGHIKGIKIVESGIDYVEGMWKNTDDDASPTSEFEFQEDERITSLKMWEGHYKGCLAVFGGFEFITSKGRYYRAIGDGLDYDDFINMQIPSVGVELAGFYGRSALVIDQLGFYWQ